MAATNNAMPAKPKSMPPDPPADAPAEERAAYWEAEARRLRARLEELEAIVALLSRRVFGASSEKLPETLSPAEQPLAGFEAAMLEASQGAGDTAEPGNTNDDNEPEASPQSAPAKAPKKRKPYTARGSIILDGLRREETILMPAEAEAEPEKFRRIGQETTEILERKAAEFYVRLIVRPKFVPIDAASRQAAADGASKATAPIVAPLPTLFGHSYASPSLLAWIIVSRFEDHLPYHRISAGMRRDGIILDASQMGRWVGDLFYTYLGPILAAIHAEVFAGSLLEADETPVRYLPEKKKKTKPGGAQESGSSGGAASQEPRLEALEAEVQKILARTEANNPGTKAQGGKSCPKGYLWIVRNSGSATIFRWSTSRGKEVIEGLVPPGWRGTIMCDDYAVYRSLRDSRNADGGPAAPSIVLAACMAHIRRKFYDAKDQFPAVCRHVLGEFGKLYHAESQHREKGSPLEAVLEMRQSERRPALAALKKYLEEQAAAALPQSSLGKAISYALNQWDELEPYLANPAVPPDNNAAERAIRPTAVGKKNYLFFGSAESGHANAAMYTLLECCRQRGLNPQEYLQELLGALPMMLASEAPEWTPLAYARRKAAEKTAQATAAEAAGIPLAEAA